MAKKKVKKVDWEEIKWGTLEAWLKRHERAIKRHYGRSPFNKDGTISLTIARKLYRDEKFLKRLTKKWKAIKKKLHFYIYVIRG